ncbi:MAG: hypothetical protein PHC34_00260 [Candidatus Gastranaerophilales bacterium]|nr:hypothetical protein [Candidatus Gastranaerophilales bacterium]
MAQRILTKSVIVSIVMLVIATFGYLINLINNYDNYAQNTSSHVVSAFDG